MIYLKDIPEGTKPKHRWILHRKHLLIILRLLIICMKMVFCYLHIHVISGELIPRKKNKYLSTAFHLTSSRLMHTLHEIKL
jgi:hypothetical protein